MTLNVQMNDLQQAAHDEGHDYADGSPHIKHHKIRTTIVETLQDVVRNILDRQGRCRVVEIGAGHGGFTDHLVAAGATVEVTEMSRPSAAELTRRFRHNPAVTVTVDLDGSAATSGPPVDVVVCLSVLHHIPDYLAAVEGMVDRIAPGGSFVSFQDPLWYSRRKRSSLLIERAAYLAWRVPQGQLRRGIAATARRARGKLDETNPSDMVEYHVVRQGVDDQALEAILRPRFRRVEIRRYWSSHLGWTQAAGQWAFDPNTFGLVATDRGRSLNCRGSGRC